jgi:Sec-independent protein translocase protein TatA
MYHWKDMQSITPDRKQKAEESLAAFRKVMRGFQEEQEQQDKREREEVSHLRL